MKQSPEKVGLKKAMKLFFSKAFDFCSRASRGEFCGGGLADKKKRISERSQFYRVLAAAIAALALLGAVIFLKRPVSTYFMVSALHEDNLKEVKFFLDAGADADANAKYLDYNGNKYSALACAVESCSAECVRLLLDAGADANVKLKDYDGNEYTALDYAIQMRYTDIVDLLVEAQKKR